LPDRITRWDRVTVDGENPKVSPGSARELTFKATRNEGFDGPIRIEIDGLPAGFTFHGPIEIEAGQSDAIGTLSAAADSAIGFRYTRGMRRRHLLITILLAGCAPGAFPKPAEPPVAKPEPAKAAPIQTRKTLGKTTQNVLELSKALTQGAVLAETSIEGSGLEIAAEAYRTQVGKAGSLAVEQRMQLYNAEHGEYPQTYDEFMTLILGKGQPDGLNLPMLPYYQEWAYDVEHRKLVVVEFPAKKEQREKETTGAAGL
jgi:hypothetical protein